MADIHEYWNSFYQKGKPPQNPSSFATWVSNTIPYGQPIAEFGFGNGRDSFYFSSQNHQVTAFDFAETAVSQAQKLAKDKKIPASFALLDLQDKAATKAAASGLANKETKPIVYARFLIHSLKNKARNNLFDLAQEVSTSIFLEFRTNQDSEERHIFGDDHFRLFLGPEQVEQELKSRGAQIVRSEASKGLAVYKDEDPHVARIIAEWN